MQALRWGEGYEAAGVVQIGSGGSLPVEMERRKWIQNIF